VRVGRYRSCRLSRKRTPTCAVLVSPARRPVPAARPCSTAGAAGWPAEGATAIQRHAGRHYIRGRVNTGDIEGLFDLRAGQCAGHRRCQQRVAAARRTNDGSVGQVDTLLRHRGAGDRLASSYSMHGRPHQQSVEVTPLEPGGLSRVNNRTGRVTVPPSSRHLGSESGVPSSDQQYTRAATGQVPRLPKLQPVKWNQAEIIVVH
jgi:hypothetical protein